MSTSTIKAYSLGEEIANAVSHGLGALLSVAGLTLLVTYASIQGDPLRITSFAIYGGCMVLLFMASTLYHALDNEKAKRIFKLLDHCAIYLLIAGSYTPLMLLVIKGSLGYTMLAVVWTIALAGIAFKIKFGHKYRALSITTFLGMGWISLFVIDKLIAMLPTGGMVLLASGGLVYSLGVIFYVQNKIPFNHAIWHLFVLGGAMCHFFMMLLYV